MSTPSNQNKPITRREFATKSAAAAIAAAGLGTIASQAASARLLASNNPSLPALVQDQKASKLITGKDDRLLVLKPFPAVLETPLKLLNESFSTPTELLFVRNNQQPRESANLDGVELAGWKIQFSGLLNKPLTIDASELTTLPIVEKTIVLQCSGNGRSLYSKTAKTSGTQWGRGGMGCVSFSGVMVSTLLDKLGLEPEKNARYVRAEGKDMPAGDKEDFLHSLPVDEFINRSMIVTTMNGKPLPAIHGGPIRLVTPGVYATMNLKWLNKLTFESNETKNYNHAVRYRVPKTPMKPGAEFDFQFTNSNFNWDMKLKTVLLNPNDGSELKSGPLSIEGVAFNDGQAKIQTVLVSMDQGTSWTAAQLDHPESMFAWTRFKFPTKLASGKHSIWTRAIDSRGRSQPLDGSIVWNPRGYEWNGVEKVEVTVS